MRPLFRKIPCLVGLILVIILIAMLWYSQKGKKDGNEKTNSNYEDRLRKAAQKALEAIGVNRSVKVSYPSPGTSQHVFNNGLLKIYYNALKEFLNVYGGQLEDLKQNLMIPLSPNVQDAIRKWVVDFSSEPGEPRYVDFNADVYGEYVRQLRDALVEYLDAETSVNEYVRNRVQKTCSRVELIAKNMVKHEVYVDPMARDKWLKENRKTSKLYEQIKRELENMFQKILEFLRNVSDKIRDFRRRNNGDSSDLK